ncbi:accessory gene regulator B family protein [Paenibacillus caseinilyticus]|uniref:accessory gene regulator B family protein n=1 Tax=Paenibacillus mucilaginosus TaxID=61624 RepID=UPI0002592600
MNWIDRYAMKIAVSIRNNYNEASSEKVLFYSLSLIINTLTAIIAIILISLFTQHFWEALFSTFSLISIRSLSGGFHLKSSLSCCVFTIFLVSIISLSSFDYSLVGFSMDIFSLLIYSLYAPKGIENVSRIAPKYYIYLKYTCLVIICTNFFIQSPILSSVFFLQGLTLTNLGYFLVHKIEERI